MPEAFRYIAPIPAANRHHLKPSQVLQAQAELNNPPFDAYQHYLSTHHRHASTTSEGLVRPSTVVQRSRQRIYDRPGRKPGAKYESDTTKLADTHELGGGTAFAVAWIHKAFKDEVGLRTLVRFLKPEEIGEMGFTGGFTPAQAYDGFLAKIADRFECGLCGEDKRANWKHKKDSIRHFQKCHCGLAESCAKW